MKMEDFRYLRTIGARLLDVVLDCQTPTTIYLHQKRKFNDMKKYSILFVALLTLTAITACQKKEQNAAAPAAPAPAAAVAPAAPAAEAAKPADAAAPAAPEKK